jgi:hypothetical protein
LSEIVKEDANESSHPIRNPLLLVMQPYTRDNKLIFVIEMHCFLRGVILDTKYHLINFRVHVVQKAKLDDVEINLIL